MSVWVSASISVILFIAAFLSHKNKSTRGYSIPLTLSAGFFMAYSLLVLFLIYR